MKCLGGCIPIRPKKMTHHYRKVSQARQNRLYPQRTHSEAVRKRLQLPYRADFESAGAHVQKTSTLSARVNILNQRTIREKLVNYFYQLSAVIGTNDFQLPYSMTTLADYLCVDRSAMTRELKHMKKDGLIEGYGKISVC